MALSVRSRPEARNHEGRFIADTPVNALSTSVPKSFTTEARRFSALLPRAKLFRPRPCREINRHRQCRHLHSHFAADKPTHTCDFLRRKPAAVAFFGDDGNRILRSRKSFDAEMDAKPEGADGR